MPDKLQSGIAEDVWLSTVIGIPCFSASAFSGADLAEALRDFGPSAFFFSKVPTPDISRVRKFRQAGFYLVDTGMHFM